MLERLAAAGIVTHTRRGNTVEYVAVPAQDVLHKLRERYTKPLDYLEATLPTIVSSETEPDVQQIASRDAIIDHARVIVRNAKSEIYVSIWSENLDPLRSDLAAADERGVKIFGMLYGQGTLEVGWWQHHSYRETVASRIGGRMLDARRRRLGGAHRRTCPSAAIPRRCARRILSSAWSRRST